MTWIVARLVTLSHPSKALAAALVLLGMMIPAAQAVDIGPGDRVTVRVLGQPEFSGKFKIQADGTINIPFVGTIPIKGLTLKDARQLIARRLADGFLKNPNVDVRIAELRPIYVIGDVKKPGRYPFRDGATVATAIAEAGGVGIALRDGGAAIANLFNAEIRVRVLQRRHIEMSARAARIQSAIDDRDKVVLPAFGDLPPGVSLSAVLERENRRLRMARQAHRETLDILRRRLPLLKNADKALARSIELKKKQLELVEQRLRATAELARQRLLRFTTQLELKRDQTQLLTDITNFRRERLRIEIERNQLQTEILKTESTRRRELMNELQEVRIQLGQINAELPAARKLLRWREAQTATASNLRDVKIFRTTLTRRSQDGVVTVRRVTNTEQLEPGDTVEIRVDQGNNVLKPQEMIGVSPLGRRSDTGRRGAAVGAATRGFLATAERPTKPANENVQQ